jgi:tetratricopeptide (TPR) repeat protein
MTKARLAIARGRPGEAVTAIRPLTEVEGPTAEVLSLYGEALFDAGETEAAVASWDRALQADGGFPEALFGRARAEVRGESPIDARNWVSRAEEALRTRIRPPVFRAKLAILRGRAHLLGRNEQDQAAAAFRQAIAIEGAPAEAHFFLGEALSGTSAADARAAYQRYLELAPEGDYASRARRAIQRR